MQNDQTLHTLEILIKFSTLFKGVPYKWDRRNKCLLVSTENITFKDRICQFCPKFSIFVRLAYVIARLIIELSKEDADFYIVIWLLVWFWFCIWGVISFHNAKVNCKDVTATFKGVKQFYAEMTDGYGYRIANSHRKYFKDYNLLQIQIMAVLWIVISLNVTLTCMFLAIPYKPQYISSLMGREKLKNPLILIPFAIAELYFTATSSMIEVLDGFHVLVTAYVAVFWMEKLRVCKTSIRKTIRDYHKFQVLIAAFNHSNSKALVPFLFFWGPGGFVLISGFGSIRFHGHISFFEYMPFPISVLNCTLIMILGILSSSTVQESSFKLYQSILTPGIGMSVAWSKIVRKEMKALKPFGIGIQAGSVKSVKRIHICIILYIISDTIMSLLVTYPPSLIFPESN